MDDLDDGNSLLFKSWVELCEPPTGTNMARELIDSFKRHCNRDLMVDAKSNRHWTGAKLLDCCGRIATRLVRQAGIQANDVVMTICDRDESEEIVALGIVLAGGALYPTTPIDGYDEAQLLCELVQPQALVINSKYHARALKLRQNVAGMSDARIIWIDGVINGVINGVHGIQTITTNGFQLNANMHTTNGSGNKTLIDDNNNNNNNNNCKSQIESSAERDQVIRLANIESEPLDMKLVELIANEQIKHNEHICNYMLTSGSTGRPKVVPSSHESTMWGLYSMISATKNPLKRKLDIDENNNNNNNNEDNSQESNQQTYIMPLTSNDVVAGDLPLDHGIGLNIMFLSLCLGAKFIVMPSFDVNMYWKSVVDYKITFSEASTSFCFQLFNHLKRIITEDPTKLPDLSSLSYICCCGAKLAFYDLIKEIQAYYPHLIVNQGYGCTEIGYMANLPKPETRSHTDSVGYLMPGIIAKVVDPDNLHKSLGPEQRGELLIWSRSMFKKYRCCPGVDAEQISKNCRDSKGLFYRTGDQVHFDRDGRLYVHGRFKDTLVLMGEWKIMPAELEEVIDEHPLVDACAVVGVPNPDLSGCHKPKAFVKLTQLNNAHKSCADKELVAKLKVGDFDFIAKHIYNFVADRSAPAKHLTGGVRIVDDFPRVGLLRKIDRKALKELD